MKATELNAAKSLLVGHESAVREFGISTIGCTFCANCSGIVGG